MAGFDCPRVAGFGVPGDKKAERRRGRGIWGDSAQHCWAACFVGMLFPPAGSYAAYLEDINELLERRDDWIRDIVAQSVGAMAAWGMYFSVPKMFPETACDCACATSGR